MNSYIHAQILNIISVAKSFEQGCQLAAVKNDGVISPEEEKDLKQIHAAVAKFIKELGKIRC